MEGIFSNISSTKLFFPISISDNSAPFIRFCLSNVEKALKTSSKGFCLCKIFLHKGSSLRITLALFNSSRVIWISINFFLHGFTKFSRSEKIILNVLKFWKSKSKASSIWPRTFNKKEWLLLIFLLQAFMTSIYSIISIETRLVTHFSWYEIITLHYKGILICFKPRFFTFSLIEILLNFVDTYHFSLVTLIC